MYATKKQQPSEIWLLELPDRKKARIDIRRSCVNDIQYYTHRCTQIQTLVNTNDDYSSLVTVISASFNTNYYWCLGGKKCIHLIKTYSSYHQISLLKPAPRKKENIYTTSKLQMYEDKCYVANYLEISMYNVYWMHEADGF